MASSRSISSSLAEDKQTGGPPKRPFQTSTPDDERTESPEKRQKQINVEEIWGQWAEKLYQLHRDFETAPRFAAHVKVPPLACGLCYCIWKCCQPEIIQSWEGESEKLVQALRSHSYYDRAKFSIKSRLKRVITRGIDVKTELSGNLRWLEFNWHPERITAEVRDFGSPQAPSALVCCVPEVRSGNEVLARAIGFSHFSLKQEAPGDSEDD